jgi:hypothetical protein
MDIFWVLPNEKSNYEKISKWISLKIYEEGRDLNLYSWFESKVNSAMYFYKINNTLIMVTGNEMIFFNLFEYRFFI